MPIHNIQPIYNKDSRILILGSFPSVKSREGMFFYDHPQNRFWKVLASVLNKPVPVTHEQKREFLLDKRIALWDVLASCEISGSSDSSIKKALPNDLSIITDTASIQAIFCNGASSFSYFQKFFQNQPVKNVFKLPSTSPANAAFSFEMLCDKWFAILQYLED